MAYSSPATPADFVPSGTAVEGLLAAMPWGVISLAATGTVSMLNPQAALLWGLPAAAILGRCPAEVQPAVLPDDLVQALAHAVVVKESAMSGDYWLPHTKQWIQVSTAPAPENHVWVYWDNRTAHQAVEQHQREQQHIHYLLAAAEEIAHTGSYEGDLATGQLRFSDGLFRLFGEIPQSFTPSQSFVDARSYPDDVGAIQHLLAQAVVDKQPYRYLRRIYRADGELRILEGHGRIICDAAGNPIQLLGLVQDVTERVQAEAEALRAKEELAQRAMDKYFALFTAMDEGGCLVEVLFDANNQPVDYRFLEVNPAFERQTDLCQATGHTMRELVPDHEQYWFDIYGQVALTGKPIRFEQQAAQLHRWYDVNAFRIGRPEDHQVAILFNDITARQQVEEVLRQSEEQYRSLAGATSDTVYKMSPDWRQMHHLLSKDFLADTSSSSGTWMEGYIPAADQPHVQAVIDAAIQTKSMFELEHRVVRADGTVGWIYSRAFPVFDAQGNIREWLGAAQDVTLRKQAALQLQDFNAVLEQQIGERTQALHASHNLLYAVAESQTALLSAFKAVRDEHNRLIDLECIFVNSRTGQQAQEQPVVGQRYLGLFPKADHADLLDRCRRVIDTGVADDQEVAHSGELRMNWFRTIVTALGDGVLISREDITSRKQNEQERTTTLRLLEQAEAVATMGSWNYDLATQVLTWSSGMYHLFGLPLGSLTQPRHYLDCVVEEDRLVAERLVRRLQAETSGFEETLRLHVDGSVKTIRSKAILLYNEQGQPVQLLGVDLDISDAQRLEAENQSLKLDRQKELLLAILQAQETERKRLAETLHNGLGQVLYATKLHLNKLDAPALHALSVLDDARAHADRLLAEAIRQTRTLAHELVPTSLEQVGLATALHDICRDLTTPHLRLTCRILLDEQVLPQPVQVALYRLAQELAHNIHKHAGARHALLELETLPGWVVLRAEDDGHGFDPTIASQGLGLRMLYDAVDLLGGTVVIDSSPEYGTHIRLRIPFSLLSAS